MTTAFGAEPVLPKIHAEIQPKITLSSVKDVDMLPVWDLQNRFSLHQTSAQSTQQMELMRSIAHSYATVINETVPDGREKELAMTKLEEVVFWANAALARYQAKNGKEEHAPGQNRTM